MIYKVITTNLAKIDALCFYFLQISKYIKDKHYKNLKLLVINRSAISNLQKLKLFIFGNYAIESVNEAKIEI